MQVSTTRLNQSQTSLLLAMLIAESPEESKSIAHRSERTKASAHALMQLKFVVIGEHGAAVTPAGIAELKSNGYVDEAGETTEFGQEFYQQAVASLNEYQIIHELLLRDWHDFASWLWDRGLAFLSSSDDNFVDGVGKEGTDDAGDEFDIVCAIYFICAIVESQLIHVHR